MKESNTNAGYSKTAMSSAEGNFGYLSLEQRADGCV